MQYRPRATEAEILSSFLESGKGFCLGCGSEADGVEPDARQYRCEVRQVYGLEELLIMDLILFTDGDGGTPCKSN